MLNFCPECGNRLSETDKFCPHCGYALIQRKASAVLEGDVQNEENSTPSSDASTEEVSGKNVPLNDDTSDNRTSQQSGGRYKISYSESTSASDPVIHVGLNDGSTCDLEPGQYKIIDANYGHHNFSFSTEGGKPVKAHIVLTASQPRAIVNIKYNPKAPGKIEVSSAIVQDKKSKENKTTVNSPVTKAQPVKKKKSSWPVVVVVLLIIWGLFRLGSAPSNKKTSTAKPVTVSPSAVVTPKATTAVPTSTPAPATPVTYDDTFYIELLTSPEHYEGKYVKTSFPIDYIYSSGEIRSKSASGRELEVETENKTYNNNSNYKYATIKGRVSSISSSRVEIKNVTVDYIGSTIPADLSSKLADYTEQVRQGKIAARDEFISSASTVSYSELARYPDTYRNQPLVMSVYVTEVEADGLLSNGTVKATYGGGEIAIYDHREVREPRLKAGDSLIVYAKGDGLTKITTYVKGSGFFGTDIGADVVGEREIPAVEMIYTNLDRVESFGLSSSSGSSNNDDYYYNLGKQAADKLNQMMGAGD